MPEEPSEIAGTIRDSTATNCFHEATIQARKEIVEFWYSFPFSERERLTALFASEPFLFFLKNGFFPERSNPVCELLVIPRDPWARRPFKRA